MAALRIAILSDAANQFAAWENKLIAEIADDDRLELAAILVCKRTHQPSNRLFRWLMNFEAQFFPKGNAPKRLPDGNGETAIVDLGAGDSQAVGRLNLDLILNHGGVAVDEKLIAAARWGVWALDFNSGPEDRRALAGFWEAKRQDAVTEVALLAYAGKSPRQIIAQASYNTKISASFNAAFLKEKSATLVIRELRRLAMEGASAHSVATARKQPAYPDLLNIVSYYAGLFRRLAGRIQSIMENKAGMRPGMWQLKTGRGDFSGVAGVLDFDPASGANIIPEGNHYWADPFIIARDGEEYVFFEDFDYRSGRGCISVGKFEGGEFKFLGEALRCDYHLSFPYLFEDNDALYMMPESNEAARIEVWRCVKFPFVWELHATMLEGSKPADSAIIRHNGAWWVFSNLCTDSFDDHCSELYVFKVDGPSLNNVIAHDHNPVVIGCAAARNGGRIFRAGGKLLRASQNNRLGTYGYGLNFCEIEELSLTQYRENVIRRIEPDFDPGIIGCHHFDYCGDRWVIDIRRKTGGRPRRVVR